MWGTFCSFANIFPRFTPSTSSCNFNIYYCFLANISRKRERERERCREKWARTSDMPSPFIFFENKKSYILLLTGPFKTSGNHLTTTTATIQNVQILRKSKWNRYHLHMWGGQVYVSNKVLYNFTRLPVLNQTLFSDSFSWNFNFSIGSYKYKNTDQAKLIKKRTTSENPMCMAHNGQTFTEILDDF